MTLTTYNPGYIVACTTCLNQFRCESIIVPLAGAPKFCPYCGASTVVKGIDHDRDYWYAITESLGFVPHTKSVELVQELYKLWDTTKYQRFRDFVENFENDN